MTAPQPAEPALEFLAHFHVELERPHELGTTPAGERRIIGITGGHFAGPALTGTILPGGADWQIVQPGGTAVIDTRYTLRTDDGALLYVATSGYRYGPPSVLARLRAGEAVDPTEYYFRLTARLETAAKDYLWVNHTLVIASAVREADAVGYDAYAVR